MTKMREEIDQIPLAAERVLKAAPTVIAPVAAMLRELDPKVVVTIARGSSDHAAQFLKYAIELELGLPVASLGPSIASIYGAELKLDRAAAIAVSQSGASADIVELARTARRGGAATLALVNTTPSLLSDECEVAINIEAGPEYAVAATKSYVNSIVAGLALIAHWSQDERLMAALQQLPTHLDSALSLDWSHMLDPIAGAKSLYMLGRGPSMAIAMEAALKCKETSGLHAEAYSSAEMLHGPVSLVDRNFPVIAFAARDKAHDSIKETLATLTDKNPHCYVSSDKSGNANQLPFIATGHPLTDALCLIVPFYGFVEKLSLARGFNPDKPVALKKVTVTR